MHLTIDRNTGPKSTVHRLIAATAALVALEGTAVAVSAAADPGDRHVGRQADGSVLTPTNQLVTPAGRQVEFAGRPVAVALRPDGKTATVLNGAVGGAVSTLEVIDLATGSVLQHYQDGDTSSSFDGIAYSPDGNTLFSSGATNKIGISSVAADGTLGSTSSVTLPAPAAGGSPYPGGLAVSPDGKTVYAAASRSNSLAVVDVAGKAVTSVIAVGNAPHSVVLDGGTAWVSDEGGRPARPGDRTNDSSGTQVVADDYRGAASTGTVSVVDLASGKTVDDVEVGLHPTALLLASRYLFVANTDSDTVSVIDTTSHQVVSTISIRPFAQAPYGSSPTGLAMLPGDRLAVTLGRNNAVAVYDWHGPRDPASFEGLVPAGWYPAAVAYDPAHTQLVVVNDHGAGTVEVSDADPSGQAPRMVQQNVGSVSLVPAPSAADVAADTDKVVRDNGWNAIDYSCPSANAAPVAIPEHIGEPSLIKHVVYIIKENRTYDQVMGDDGRGNGDPALTQFGAQVTPNQHALAKQFPLFDNFYDSGSLSADGHQWVVQADAPDYLEKFFGGNTRSYPAMGYDALTYLPSGFLWEDALQHGKSVANFAEYAIEELDASRQNPETSDIPSLNQITIPDYAGFDLNIPDQHRADVFLQHFTSGDFNGNHTTGQTTLPDLTMMRLPDDHTGGTNPSFPSPVSEVADNDLALGRIVDAITHSDYWKSTAIFVEEDDSQAGTDHVDGHRSTLFVLSPYARHGGYVDHDYFTQVNVVRTIEQILGIPPLNQLDLAAEPMRSAFTNTPDYSAYDVTHPNVLLGAPNPPVSRLTGLARAWAIAAEHQNLRHTDAADPAFLNRDIWYSVKGFATPYPGDKRVLLPSEVPDDHASFGDPDDAPPAPPSTRATASGPAAVNDGPPPPGRPLPVGASLCTPGANLPQARFPVLLPVTAAAVWGLGLLVSRRRRRLRLAAAGGPTLPAA